jgi:hypothetical protein
MRFLGFLRRVETSNPRLRATIAMFCATVRRKLEELDFEVEVLKIAGEGEDEAGTTWLQPVHEGRELDATFSATACPHGKRHRIGDTMARGRGPRGEILAAGAVRARSGA